ncbi:Aldo-keto reductase family 1 member B10 [Orchesella cincta]|uniref:Aldo-keto reductase family 1 member B10 n=1 Tax=Orchesella cincta TaxID=48709 RepID=A0A1D2MB39_ORCCI|nr:Aldo-keto reductase family 1 member B10 [Orchesella cincta]
MATLVPKIKLNNGQEMPVFGLGTWKSKPGEVTQAVKDAIDAGYRHIDGALIYQNEPEVGAGIKAKIDEGVVKREDLFVVSKLWNNSHRPDLVEPAIKTTLKDLGLEYVDLYLIHWPCAFKEGGDLTPKDAEDKLIFSDADFVDTWKAMEEVAKKGLAKSIGVSNFNSEQLERLLSSSSITPVTNQVECHPYLNQRRLIEFCKSKNISITAYSPFGSPDRPWAQATDPKLLEDPKLVEVGKKYNKTPAQVILRWMVQRDLIVIPKSVNKGRIGENFNIFDFQLTDEDMEVIYAMDRNWRAVPAEHFKGSKDYPFNIEF